ncbi:uroporphyrinogen decarboxylase [Glycocaulis alkaliphilus]|uniref:Uroporphyrinogen decarboxylase n=1 Tax=Glycocaulis alkaliphilus TaxID=1434191 RepID=A0A3T0E5R7_9PROT|nr:uroporphyrinogen decarboxylase [Glycocaulis alkaliphilus]AZU02620.1 uroporphyrinogen decarboxylase [Glycocaulis alkaliphilus]GGB80282.1 uroporphyrinogen decarboxylase [Glycocaulis alkaliphilus]
MTERALLKVLSGETLKTPPVWLMRQAGRYLPEYRAVRAQQPDFIAFCLNPEAAAEVTLQPIRRYGFDASIVFADILLIPHAMGQKVWFEKGEGPRLAAMSLDTLSALRPDGAAQKLSAVCDTLRLVRAGLPESCTLIGFAGAPWTVATYMIEGGGSKDRWKARTAAWSEPETMDRLLANLADTTADYLIAQAKAGADVLKIFESWAEGLPAPLFNRVVIAPTRRIVERVRAAGITAPIIGFPKGAGPHYVRYAEETGIDAIATDHGLDTDWAVANLPRSMPVQGQLDPAVLRAGGTALEGEVSRLLDAWGGRPYVFNLGHGINPDVPPEHVSELLAHIRGR